MEVNVRSDRQADSAAKQGVDREWHEPTTTGCSMRTQPRRKAGTGQGPGRRSWCDSSPPSTRCRGARAASHQTDYCVKARAD
eukprot:3334871-Rhodomonas_salina.1